VVIPPPLHKPAGEAWQFATESLELARETYTRKHEVWALRLQGEILAANGRTNEALALIQASVGSAQELQTGRDIWMETLSVELPPSNRTRVAG
jgi:hypothetical protein